jgi:transcription elongation factor GreA
MPDSIPMTRAGYDKLRADLDQLKNVEMPIIEERIGHARAEGDLSENAEYHGARESQALLQARIDLLNDKLARATIISAAQVAKDVVGFGCTVKVKDLDLDEEEEFTLVGGGEEDYTNGKILITSPLAQGMVGKRVGDKVEIQVPMGTTRFEILAIRFDD